jgi:hypothetical protein
MPKARSAQFWNLRILAHSVHYNDGKYDPIAAAIRIGEFAALKPNIV